MKRLLPLMALALLSCQPTEEVVELGPVPDVDPGAPALRRLTATQYHNAVEALFSGAADLYIPDDLEPDDEVEGLLSVGAGTNSLSSYGVELYEEAAYLIAEQVTEDEETLAWLLPCEPESDDDEVCASLLLEELATRAWRRPVEDAELERLTAIVSTIGADAGSFSTGAMYGIAAVLQSPYFVYRVEYGGDDGALDDWELATRLSFLLWNTIPDDELLAAASAGELATDAGLEAQARRMLADERAEAGIDNLFDEIFTLYELEDLNKDETVFTHASPELGDSAREETLLLLENLILEEDADFRELFVTQRSFVDRRLAALYSIPAPQADGFDEVWLEEDQGRRGLLGQASVLLQFSHPTSSSATKRGKFVRTKLLCHEIPSPPADVDTSIPEADADAPTLRERLQVHMEAPSCSGCHQLTDPIGLGLENFDGMGRWRDTENGATIDPSGDLDDIPWANAWEMGEVIAQHEDLGPCFASHLYKYSTGRSVDDGEEALVEWLGTAFAAHEYSFQELLVETILSDGFRTVGEVE